MRLKVFVYTLLLLSVFSGARSQTNEPWCAVVKQADGMTTEFMFCDDPHITYGDGVVKVSSGKMTLELKSTQVKNIILRQKDSVQGIAASKSANSNVKVSFSSNSVIVTGLEPGINAALYTTDGRQLKIAKATADGTLSLSLPVTTQSVFIIKTNNQTFKVINKQ